MNTFLYKKLCPAFFYLQFGFVTFWLENIGTKAARKMLVTLHKGANFANIL